METSILGSTNMLQLANRLNAKILQSSTSEVYGDPKIHPQIESYWGNVNPIGDRACYDESKRAAEALFINYNKQHNVRIKIMRIFNTYGPHMHPNDGRVVSNFIIQALNNQDITIYGNGNQSRSFCYYSDLIDGMVKLMNTDDNITGPINIGNPNEFTILELAEKVIKLTNSNSKLIYKTLPADDPVQRQPNIELAKKTLNWEPKVQLEEGLIETIKYFKNII